MSSEETIEIYLKSAPQKLRSVFPHDPKGDIQIQFKGETYNLQKAHLRLQSNYFRKFLTHERSILQIDEQFQVKFLSTQHQFMRNVLYCFYGGSCTILKKDIMEYYPIIKFLGVGVLADLLRRDMINNSNCYNLFELFELAYKYNEQKIFENCLSQLQKHKFSQIREQRNQLLKSSREIFKLVLTTHSRSPNRILTFYEIQSLISDYGEIHYLEPDEIRYLKFELIDKNKLTSQEYRDIFIKKNKSQIKGTNNNNNFNATSMPFIGGENQIKSEIKAADKRFSISMNYEQYQRALTLEMQHTFHKKISEQLQQEKKKITHEILSLKQSTHLQSKMGESFKLQFHKMRKNINHFDNEEKVINRRFKNLDDSIKDIQKDFQQQEAKINGIKKNLQEIFDKYDKKEGGNDKSNLSRSSYSAKSQEPPLMDSGIVNLDSIDQIFAKKIPETPKNMHKSPVAMKKNPSASPPTKQTQLPDQIYSQYGDDIVFDKKPCTIALQSELLAFMEIIQSSRFQKKSLKLIFRLSNSAQKVGNIKDMRNKNMLVFLFRTKSNKLIGGFMNETMTNKKQDIADKQAFIFSVTHKRKFKVKPEQANEAIMVQNDYIICFGTDLMISEKWNQEQNFCSWPERYESEEKLNERGSEWLVGDSQFSLTDIECYHLQEQILEMMQI